MWTSVIPLLVALVACLLDQSVASEESVGCGGTYRGFQYTITSPNYPLEYPHGVDCVYRLEGADESVGCEQIFHLQFLDFELDASENCKGDYLMVGERNVFCGSTVGVRRFTGRNDSLTVRFHTDSKDSAKGFKILVSALPCSLKLSPLKNRSEKENAAEFRSNDHTRGIRDEEDNQVGVSSTLPPRITSYLFLPPGENSSSARSINRPVDNFLPPKLQNAAKDKSSTGLIPVRSNGETGIGVVDYELQVAGNDCDKGRVGSSERTNYDSKLALGSPGLLYDPRHGFGESNGLYPGGGYNPSIGYNNPAIDYPNTAFNPSGASYYSEYNPAAGYNPVAPNYSPGLNPDAYNTGYNNPGYSTSYPIGANNWNIGITAPNGAECCQVQSSRRFAIASPGFPGNGASSAYGCRYTITKSSRDVCRLRLNFRYFNFGSEDPYCGSAFLEVDGRRYCGCKTGQSLQILFGDYVAKSIIVQSGYSRNKFNGFLIDVHQEPCTVSYPYDFTNPIPPGYGYIRRRGEQLDDAHDAAATVYREKRDVGYTYTRPAVPFHHERTFGGNSCQSRVFLDWAIASKEAILRNVRCGILSFPSFNARVRRHLLSSDVNEQIHLSPAELDCENIEVSNGLIKSPLYPNNYPDNTKICYRFNREPNFCKLELYIQAFDLEESQGCEKDHLSFSGDGKKYCGLSLNDRTKLFDLTTRNSVEVYFAADSYGTGKGFNITYSQLPCDVSMDS